MKHYTLKQAKKEVGESVSYELALDVSIKKWKEIDRYGARSYKSSAHCGYCMVNGNRERGCYSCPVRNTICKMAIKEGYPAGKILARLQELKKERRRG